ncbi:type VII secretion protein EccB [Saccharopolyspora shandongensis]|uniref:type VII secretion protein EccB n=1 Tax=Saccharopolyspora shandongensis TaxID=418495 RepID=UPI003415ED46
MQTQKDHVHAYQFLMQRMTTALLVGDPSNVEPPTRRGRSGLIAGALIALLVVIGFGVYGLVVPGGNTAWKQKGAILVERESGSRYVYVGGRLLPTPNQASAMLTQGPGSKITLISRSSLAGLARGPQVGIEGAPDTVPRPDELMPGQWLLCPSAAPNGPGMSVNFDDSVPNGTVPDEFYVPVQTREGKLFLIWRGVKYRVPDVNSLVVLGLGSTLPLTVPDLWLGLIPEGPELAAADIDGAGEPGPKVAGSPHRVGDLFFHNPGNGTEQHYVLVDKGLVPLSATEYALLEARPGKTPVEIDARSVLAAPFSPDDSMLTRLPDLAGKRPLPGSEGQACLKQNGRGTEITTSVVAVPGAEQWPPVTVAGALLPPSRGVLVAELPVPNGRNAPNRYLISDRGRRFLIPDNDSLQALGLGDVQPVPMRTELLSTIPAGPVLSRTAVVVGE